MTDSNPKLLTLEDLLNIIDRLRKNRKKIVWTNGCFDILHPGHVHYLEQAKSDGDILIVGVNSDRSVQVLKGPARPVFKQQDRAAVVSALAVVDYVIIFDEPTPLEIISKLKPEVYVKGGDYSIDTIDQRERNCVENYDGVIKIVLFLPGYSTTEIIQKLKSTEID